MINLFLSLLTAAWLLGLGSESYFDREKASARLRAQGLLAYPALKQGLAATDPEVRHRCDLLLSDQYTQLQAARQKLIGVWLIAGCGTQGYLSDAAYNYYLKSPETNWADPDTWLVEFDLLRNGEDAHPFSTRCDDAGRPCPCARDKINLARHRLRGLPFFLGGPEDGSN